MPTSADLGSAGPHQRTALAVVAHADDESLGAGGTIAQLTDQGWLVYVVVMTDGLVTRGKRVDDNREHCRAACSSLGCEPPAFLGFGDQRLDTVPLAVLADTLHEHIARYPAPRLVMTHDRSDSNADHRACADSVALCWRPAPGAPAILAMEIPGSFVGSGTVFDPNFFVDVGATLDTKLAAISLYTNELRRSPHLRSIDAIRTLTSYRGAQCGRVAAEAFRVVRAESGQLP